MPLKRMLPLVKKSAKKSFVLLRKRSPLECAALQTDIHVTKLFFNHIAHIKKRKRNVVDLIERLLIIPFIDDILAYGNCIERRRQRGKMHYKIALKKGHETFCVILIEKKEKIVLLSCFIDEFHKRKNPS